MTFFTREVGTICRISIGTEEDAVSLKSTILDTFPTSYWAKPSTRCGKQRYRHKAGSGGMGRGDAIFSPRTPFLRDTLHCILGVE